MMVNAFRGLVVVLVAAAIAFAGEAQAGCALKSGVVLVTLDEKAATATVAKAGKQFVMKGEKGAEIAVDLAKLGLPAGKGERYVGWDCSAKNFLPPFASPLKVTPTGPRYKVNIRRLEPRPQLVSASKGVLKLAWDAEKHILTGTSRVPANSPYHLRITTPPVPRAWRLCAANVSEADLEAGVEPRPWQSGPWAGVILRSPKAREVAWVVFFEPEPARSQKATVANLRAMAPSHKRIEVTWSGTGGYYVLRRDDGPPIGIFEERYLDKDILPKKTYTYTVSALSWSGKSKAKASARVTVPEGPPPLPKPDVFISDLKAVKSTVGWNDTARQDKSIEDNPIRIAGEEYRKGMGVHAVSELVYAVKPEYARFVSYVGADDEKGQGQGSVVFEVYADTKQLYKSKVLRGGMEPAEINVEIPKGTTQLRLVVADAGDGIGSDHADWARAGFLLKKE